MVVGHHESIAARREFLHTGTEIKKLLAEDSPVSREVVERLEKQYERMRQWFALAADRAEKAAPYIHPKIASLTLEGSPENPVHVQHQIDQLAALLDQRAREKAARVNAEPMTERLGADIKKSVN